MTVLSLTLRCARACGSKEGVFSLLTRHLFLSPQSAPRKRSGLLMAVPGGTEALVVLAESRHREIWTSGHRGMGKIGGIGFVRG